MSRFELVKRLTVAILLGLATAAPGGQGWAGPGPRPDTAPDDATTAVAQTLTLITGDHVAVTDAGRIVTLVRPGPGREQVGFLTERVDGHVYVVPADALSLVAAGRVDRRLFDVTALLRFGYGDSSRADLPLIVQYGPAAGQLARARLSATGAVVKADQSAARSLVVREHKRDGVRFWSAVTAVAGGTRALASGIDHIWLDGKREILLDESVPRIGSPAAWAAGYTGSGVTVAVLDTGIDASHPDLAGKVLAEANFTEAASVDDEVGHGTHVASTIVGSGAASGGMYRGVAPDAVLASGKVCPDNWCAESAMLAGMHWAAVDQRAKVVNVSIGGWDSPGLDPLEEAVNTLTAQYGTLFVISAGNDGPGGRSVNSPGSADAALTVAAVDRSDQVAQFSSRGPRAGDGAIKPDISAPGVDIVAARARHGWIGDPVGDSYTRLSGTSMAAPHAAGAAALLVSQHPDWAPALLKAALMGSALPLPGVDVFSTGTGRLDVARAISQQVVAEPGSLSMGVQLWPHDDDEPVVRAVTYHNTAASAATVVLATEVITPHGDPAPPGAFTLSAAQLEVPASGSALASLTVDTRSVPIGTYTGRIRATVGEAAVIITPFVIEVEAERYSVTLRHTDAAGNPAVSYYSELVRTDMYDMQLVWDRVGAVTIRLPKATYALNSMVMTDPETPTGSYSMFAYPLLTVDRDITIDIDARQAKPLRFSVPDVATTMAIDVGFDGRTAWGTYSWQFGRPTEAGITTGHLGPKPPRTEFVGRVEAIMARPDVNGGFADSPYRYNLAWYTPGVLPTGFTGAVRRAELATVDETYLAQAPGLSAEKYSTPFPTLADWLSPGWLSYAQPFPVPASRTEYYLTRDVRWHQTLAEFTASGEAPWFNQWTSEPAAYQAGHRYDVRWNGAVFGPSTAGSPVTRTFGYIGAMIPMFSDGTPGHLGEGWIDTTRTALYRNGQQIAEDVYSPGYIWAEVPPNASDYRLTAEVTRGDADLSTRISAVWTFESGFTGGESATVPVMAVRYRPALDNANTAPGGRQFTIPVTVEGAVDGVRSLAVQISYDDGATWQPVELTRSHDGWSASVTHPVGAGHVALRAQATDGRGDTVYQTIIRAYHLG